MTKVSVPSERVFPVAASAEGEVDDLALHVDRGRQLQGADERKNLLVDLADVVVSGADAVRGGGDRVRGVVAEDRVQVALELVAQVAVKDFLRWS